MQVGNKYSHNGGEAFINQFYGAELQEIVDAIAFVDATSVLTKMSEEKSKPDLIFSPTELNKKLKNYLSPLGWTVPTSSGSKGFTEPRLYWNSDADTFHRNIGEKSAGDNEYREMDGIKNKVGLEIQFGKYAFMGYDIFAKMPIFSKRGLITCGIELVAMHSLIPNMSTGVSSFNQIEMDLKARGVSNLDIPILIIGIECTPAENAGVELKRQKFRTHKQTMLSSGEVSVGRQGAKPGPKTYSLLDL